MTEKLQANCFFIVAFNRDLVPVTPAQTGASCYVISERTEATMTKPGYSMKATLEMISFYASSLCSWRDNVGILKHAIAIAFQSKIRDIVLDSIFYLHPQTS